MTPRKVITSAGWKHLSMRARVILQLFQFAHDGFNNGRIKMGIHQIGSQIGNQNHAANSRAVAELIETGFLECVSDADHHHAKVRQYRLTFIATGKEKSVSPATNEFMDWRPPSTSKRKFGRAKSATQEGVAVAVPASSRKFSVALDATPPAEIDGIAAISTVATVAPILGNQSSAGSEARLQTSNHARLPVEAPGVDLFELREWARHVLDILGFGGQKVLALDADVPQPALCKFLKGKGLRADYRMRLQFACGRHTPYRKWMNGTAA